MNIKAFLKNDLNLLFRRKTFWIALIIGCIIALASVIESLVNDYYYHLFNKGHMSAIFSFIGINIHTYGNLFYRIFPLICTIPFGDIYFLDRKYNTINSILARVNRKTYFISRFITVFISGFLVLFLPMLFNQLILLIFLPVQGSFGGMTMNEWVGGYSIFKNLALYSHLLYNVVFMVITGLFGGTFATLSYGLSFLSTNKRVFITVTPFFIYYLDGFLFESLSLANAGLHLTIIAGQAVRYISYMTFVIYFIVLLIPGIFFPIFSYKKDVL